MAGVTEGSFIAWGKTYLAAMSASFVCCERERERKREGGSRDRLVLDVDRSLLPRQHESVSTLPEFSIATVLGLTSQLRRRYSSSSSSRGPKIKSGNPFLRNALSARAALIGISAVSKPSRTPHGRGGDDDSVGVMAGSCSGRRAVVEISFDTCDSSVQLPTSSS